MGAHLYLAALAFVLVGAKAYAGVVMYGTRVIYPADKSFVTVRLANQDKAPNLVQAWVDDGRGAPSEDGTGVPFIVTPPLFRVGPDGQQSVRVVFSGDAALPADRETLYWFNFLQIPPEKTSGQKDGTAQIAISFLNQVKLLYRPASIKGSVHDLPGNLEFNLSQSGKGWRITAKNPTAFHATFQEDARIRSGVQAWPVDFGGEVTLAPFSSLTWRVVGDKPKFVSPTFEFSLIDDSGNPRASQKDVVVSP